MKALATLGYIALISFVLFLCIYIMWVGIDANNRAEARRGAYLYEGESWIDEVDFTKYSIEYKDGHLTPKEISPNTVLVEYKFITRDNLPNLERRVLDGGDTEVWYLSFASIVCFVVVPALLISFLISLTRKEETAK